MGWPYRTFVRPIQRLQSSEGAHGRALRMLRIASATSPGRAMLRLLYHPKKGEAVQVWGLEFPNRFGLAAGLDKRAEALRGWSSIGFGFIEIGGVTMHAQAGNPKPRMFRDDRSRSLINRMGFNNDGSEAVAERIRHHIRRKGPLPCPVLANLGKSKITPNEDALVDYATSMERLHDVVDGFVVNVSSPNTPNLRDLQEKKPLMTLLQTLQAENQKHQNPKPILLKIAPDLTDTQLLDIIDIVSDTKIDGVIATNTTIARNGLQSDSAICAEKGGLSGKPLSNRSTDVIRFLHTNSKGSFPIIGVGGIHTPQDAIDKLEAGASLLQIYTGFVYEGPGMVKRILKAL